MEISFLHPQYLLFLLIIPALIFIHFVTLKMSANKAMRISNFQALARIRDVDFFSKNIIVLTLSGGIVFFLTLALAGTVIHVERDSSSHSFVVAIDSSKSMEADDFNPNRFVAAKEAASEFIDNAPFGTRAGVVSFSGVSSIEGEVTDDKPTIKNAIDGIEIGRAGGTDFYEAVVTSTNLLAGEESKAVILLSDGQANIGGLEDTISYALRNGITVHAIAIGTEEGGTTGYGFSKLDEDSLKAVSYNTGGLYFKAEDSESLTESFNEAYSLTRKKVRMNLFPYLVMASLFLFVLEFVLINTKFRRIP